MPHFQYRCVRNICIDRNIWDQKTAEEEHVYNPNMSYDANRRAKEQEGRILASRLLIELTNSLFGSSKILDVNRCEPYANYHGPVLKFNSLNSYQWAWIAIMSNEAISSNSFINLKADPAGNSNLKADHLQDCIWCRYTQSDNILEAEM